MRQALRLAQRAKGRTSPNPLVGAVVVKKGRVLGEGYHKAAGLAHAEVVALNKAGRAARGASLYVTLEPCRHFGQTPPCVDKIVSSGIKEVIFAMSDPNPLNNGKGSQLLRRQGIKVISGILEEEAGKVNQVFIKYITKRLPFVTVKVAQSLDGKIATASGDSRWITSLSSRKLAHKLRAQADAVLVGVNTALTDDPLLNCRHCRPLGNKQPKKIIVDSTLRLRPDLRIFSTSPQAEVIVATTRLAPPNKLSCLSKKARIIITKDKDRKVDLKALFRQLAGEGVAHILIEGGGELIASALKMGLVDRMVVFVSSKIIGGRQAPTAVEGSGIEKIKQAGRLENIKVRRLGAELIIEGMPV